MRKMVLVALLVATFTFGAAVMASAQTGSGSGDGSTAPADAAAAPIIPGVTVCNGTTHQTVHLQNVSSAARTVNEGSGFTDLTGGLVEFETNSAATLVVTLIGEGSMSGASPLDRIDVIARLDGVQMAPTLNTQFHSGEAVNSHAAMWCRAGVGVGPHTVQLQWRAVDVAPGGTVTGTLDEFVVRVELT